VEWWSETDRFDCIGPTGEIESVQVRQLLSEVEGPDGQGLVFGTPHYFAANGEPLNRVRKSLFKSPSTGLEYRRIAAPRA
jgi:hypothetical protein